MQRMTGACVRHIAHALCCNQKLRRRGTNRHQSGLIGTQQGPEQNFKTTSQAGSCLYTTQQTVAFQGGSQCVRRPPLHAIVHGAAASTSIATSMVTTSLRRGGTLAMAWLGRDGTLA